MFNPEGTSTDYDKKKISIVVIFIIIILFGGFFYFQNLDKAVDSPENLVNQNEEIIEDIVQISSGKVTDVETKVDVETVNYVVVDQNMMKIVGSITDLLVSRGWQVRFSNQVRPASENGAGARYLLSMFHSGGNQNIQIKVMSQSELRHVVSMSLSK